MWSHFLRNFTIQNKIQEEEEEEQQQQQQSLYKDIWGVRVTYGKELKIEIMHYKDFLCYKE